MLIVEREWEFRDTPVIYHGSVYEKGLHGFYFDRLTYAPGDAIDENYSRGEFVNMLHGTLRFWWRPSKDGNAAARQVLYRNASGNNELFVYKENDGYLYFSLYDEDEVEHTVSYDVSSWEAGYWYHIVCTWNLLTDSIALYADGALRDDTPNNALSSDDMDSNGGSMRLYYGYATFNGVLTYQGWHRDLSAAEITADYNSGNGVRFAIDQDVCIRTRYTEELLTACNWHTGSRVTAISQGATEATLTINGLNKALYMDNEYVVVHDGMGYRMFGFVDGDSAEVGATGTVLVDNGAGAVVTDIDKVGVSYFFEAEDGSAVHYAEAANNTIHDITGEDLFISAWFNARIWGSLPSVPERYIVTKGGSSLPTGYMFYINDSHILEAEMSQAASPIGKIFTMTGSTAIRDDRWHHIAMIIDRNSEANCKIYVDGIAESMTYSYSSGHVLADFTDLSNAGIFRIGGDWSNGVYQPEAYIRDVVIAYDADLFQAGEAGEAGAILKMATNPLDTSEYPNREDVWLMLENTGTTLSGENNDLTLEDAEGWTDDAYITRDLASDGSFEYRNIGGMSIGDNWVVTKNTTIRKYDHQSLKMVAVTAGDGDEVIFRRPELRTGTHYWYSFWCYISAVDGSSNIFFDVDGSANIIARQLDTGTDDKGVSYATGTWLYYEGCFEGDQDAVHNFIIRVTGAGAGANSCTVYLDEFKLFVNLADGGECEASSGNALPTGWSDAGSPDAAETQTDTSDKHSGESCILLSGCDAGEGVTQTITVIADEQYTLFWWDKNDSQDVNMVLSGAFDATIDSTGDNTWTKHVFDFLTGSTSLTISYVSADTGQTARLDDVSLVRLDTTYATIGTKREGHYPKDNWQSPNDFT